MRVSSFDIEATGLDATYGRLLCGCFYDVTGTTSTIMARRYKNEPRALADITNEWANIDIVVTWNGKLYDIPFVNARLMARRLELPPGTPVILDEKKHIDLRWTATKLRLRSKRMAHVAEVLGTQNSKFNAAPEDWIKAADGNRASFDLIVKHCEQDVALTYELLDILRPYIVRITR